MGKIDKNQRSEVRSQKSENGEKVSESVSEDRKEEREKRKEDKIEVEVIQAYREEVERPDGWGYVRHNVGDKVTIDASEFCANVHGKKE